MDLFRGVQPNLIDGYVLCICACVWGAVHAILWAMCDDSSLVQCILDILAAGGSCQMFKRTLSCNEWMQLHFLFCWRIFFIIFFRQLYGSNACIPCYWKKKENVKHVSIPYLWKQHETTNGQEGCTVAAQINVYIGFLSINIIVL